MPKEIDRIIDHDDKESIEHYKKEMSDTISRSIESEDGSMILIANDGEDTVVTLSGDPIDVIRLLSRAMTETDKLNMVVRAAVEIVNTVTKRKSVKPKKAKDVEDLKNIILDNLDCENCSVKETCDIFNNIMSLTDGMDAKEVMRILQQVVDQHGDKIDVGVIDKVPMGKGGDA